MHTSNEICNGFLAMDSAADAEELKRGERERSTVRSTNFAHRSAVGLNRVACLAESQRRAGLSSLLALHALSL